MFGLGFWELVAILIVAVLFLKPDDIPALFRSLGRLHGRLAGMYREMMRAAEEVEDELRRPLRSSALQEAAEQDYAVGKDERNNGKKNSPGSEKRIAKVNRKEE